MYTRGMAKDPKIVFRAAVSKIQTMADGSLRFVFDAGEKAIPEAAMLMECKRQGIYLEVTVKEAPKTKVKGVDRGL